MNKEKMWMIVQSVLISSLVIGFLYLELRTETTTHTVTTVMVWKELRDTRGGGSGLLPLGEGLMVWVDIPPLSPEKSYRIAFMLDGKLKKGEVSRDRFERLKVGDKVVVNYGVTLWGGNLVKSLSFP